MTTILQKHLDQKREDTIKLVDSFNNLTTDMGTEFDTFISELQATLSTQKGVLSWINKKYADDKIFINIEELKVLKIILYLRDFNMIFF